MKLLRRKEILMSRSLCLMAWFACMACTRPTPSEPLLPGMQEVDHIEESEHPALPRVIKLSPLVIREAGIVTAPAQKRPLAATVDLSGQVFPDPDHIAILGARVTGRVLTVLVQEGDTVKAGEAILTIASQELAQRRADYTAAAAKARVARMIAERTRALFTQRLGAEQDATVAEAEAEALEAQRDAGAKVIEGFGVPAVTSGDPSLLTIVSPLAGQVIQRDAVPGQMVDAAHVLATVADLSRAWFGAQLFEKDLSQVHEGANAEVRLNGYPGEVLAGTLTRIAAQVDPASRTLTARIAFAEANAHVRLGLFGMARISVTGSPETECITVPQAAVTEIGSGSVVFVQHPDGDFKRHDVVLGRSAGGMVAVLQGLHPGEPVVTAGVFTLKSAVLKSTIPDEE